MSQDLSGGGRRAQRDTRNSGAVGDKEFTKTEFIACVFCTEMCFSGHTHMKDSHPNTLSHVNQAV